MTRAAEMKSLRTIKVVNLRDQIRSKVIREDLEIQDGLQRRDDVDRLTEDRWAKCANDEKPNPRRHPDQPPKIWCGSWTSASQEVEQH
ncbi:hypothetical protein Trydic_g7003 [Trypoxylus dichotomus]